nr:ATP-binding cassette subfamily C4-1-2 [Brachionus rubens]
MNEQEFISNPSPLVTTGFFSKITFSWINPLLSMGRKKQLQLSDVYSPVTEDEAEKLTNDLEKEWNNEVKNSSKPSLGRAIARWYRKKAFYNALFIIFQEIIKIIQPLFISIFLRYFNGTMGLTEALIYGGVISICAIIVGILHHPYYFNACRYGMRLRLACSGLIYKKVLKLSLKTIDSKSAGDVINLLSTDATRIEYGIYYLPYLITGPIQMVIVIVIVYLEVGLTFLAGLLLLALIMPAKALIAKLYNKNRSKNCKKSDERVSVLTEILNSIKIIKMYCWEVPFSKRVTDLRNKELRFHTFLNLLQASTATIDTIMATLMSFMNISFFISFAEIPLLPSFIVFSIGFYMRLCNSIGFNFSRSVVSVINFNVSAKRIGDFLLMEELNPKQISEPIESNFAVKIERLNFSWQKDEFSLKNINIEAKKGDFISIVGPVGSGKSTLLLGLIGELENYTGQVFKSGKVFYLTQQPWVFTASIRQNIIFGLPYEKEKFDRIVEVCSLKKDLELLTYGDQTLVGEKGINLSGGQRARICLARALYSDADIYLFDDTLSAVDGTVAKNIIKNCINGYLKTKTRVLITHQVHHLETADKIYVLEEGKIVAEGTYADLMKTHLMALSSMEDSESGGDFDSLEEQPKVEIEKKTEKVLTQDLKAKQELIKKQREEVQQRGAVGWSSYVAYFTAGAGYFGIISVLILFLAAQGMAIAADYWLSIWSNKEEDYKIQQENIRTCLQDFESKDFNCSQILENVDINSDPLKISLIYDDRTTAYNIYIILVAVSFIVITLRSVAFFLLCVINSKNTYNKLFTSVRDTFIRFYDLNPLGRILNRFSKDTNNMDEMLTLYLYEFFQVSMVILGALVVPISVNPWMIIPLIPLGIVFYIIQNYFVKTARELKRLDNIGRSPIFVHTNTTIEGISTIRAADKQYILTNEYYAHNDYHTRAYFGFIVVHRWFGLRLDLLCSVYTIITLFACIFLKDNLGIKPGQIGLLMVYLFQLFDLFQWCVVLSTMVENLMTSIERIVEYTKIPGEPLYKGEKKAPINWPTRGEITFENVSLKYDENLPSVLKGISLNIKPGEKVGIVGRTGAGKSSFFQAIFRMYEPEGKILVDGVEIKQLSLKELREKLTIIPQEPVLFSGTLRYNLDPFEKYSDNQIWSAIESVSLKQSVQGMNAGLDSMITTGGTNLSVGQKQLICLARAILKKTKILIIDEATANVDYSTDAIIQKTIREQFKDCTVLTIAHRLATVVDSDRILCLSEGKIINFGVPRELLQDETSILYELTKKLSPNEKKHIFDIANNVKSIQVIPIENENKLRNEDKKSKISLRSYVFDNRAANFNEEGIDIFHPSVQTRSNYSLATNEMTEVRF